MTAPFADEARICREARRAQFSHERRHAVVKRLSKSGGRNQFQLGSEMSDTRPYIPYKYAVPLDVGLNSISDNSASFRLRLEQSYLEIPVRIDQLSVSRRLILNL